MAAEAYSLTRPHDDFNFEELLSDLITIARMIRPHLGSILVSARLLSDLITIARMIRPDLGSILVSSTTVG